MAEQMESLKKATDEFSLNLYHQISNSAGADRNIFMSPLSISSALLLVYLGAKSETRAELEAAMEITKQFAGSESAVLKAYQEVLQIFVPSKDEKGQSAFDLALANKAYVQQGLQLNPGYVNGLQQLRSEISETSFRDNPQRAIDDINAWVEDKTNKKIQNLVDSSIIDSGTLMVLVNAIYFKAAWLNKFDEAKTTKSDFFSANGQAGKVDLMFLPGKKYKYFDNEEVKLPLPSFQMIEIPYKAEEMSMIVFLPRDERGLGELEKNMSGEVLMNIYHAASQRKVDVYLPRFKLEETYALKEVLHKMGITRLFGNADLSGIAQTPLTVSAVVHKAFVEVNEEGTEAAAATAMVMTRSLMVEPTAVFRADHPFMFAIRHKRTGLITFLGRVAQFS